MQTFCPFLSLSLSLSPSKFRFSLQSFIWNLGRPVDEAEVLQLTVVSRGVLRNEKVLAKYGLVLQTVAREGRIVITDSLVDLNNKPLPVR